MSDTPPPPKVETPKAPGPLRHRISAVWLIPLIALIISLGVAWRSYSDRGPLVEIVFDDGAGIEAGNTTVRFRDVVVGTVESIRLSDDLKHVIASARINKDIAKYLDASAEFWVVRPSVNAQGISGLETVVSGVYIEAYWDNTIGDRVSAFQALENPPLTPADQPGTRVRLRAPDGGSMSVGAPVLYKKIQVGKVEDVQLSDAGDVMIDVFIDAPNDKRLVEGTRFWNASGFDISLGLQGASLNVESLISLLQGGVAFDTVGSDTKAVEEGHVYELYDSQGAARKNAIEDSNAPREKLDVYFNGSVAGLEVGADVQFRGLKVGEVSSIQAAVSPGQTVALRATLSIIPTRMGIPQTDDADAMRAGLYRLISSEVSRGMRAQLAASGLLSQTLYVDLITVEKPEPARFDPNAEPYPTIPTAPGDVSGIAASAQGVMTRLSNLPIEDLVNTVQSLLANVNTIVTDPAVRAAPSNLGLLIGDVRKVVAEPGVQRAPAQVAEILASVRSVVDQITEQQLVTRLGAALDATRTAVASIDTLATDNVPAVVAQIEALSAQLQSLPLRDLVTSGTDLVNTVDALAKGDGVQNLPASLDSSLTEVRGLLAQLREGGAVDDATASLANLREITDQLARTNLTASIQQVTDEARAAIANVNTATSQLPQLVDGLTRLSDRANQLPLEDLVTAGTRVLNTADSFLNSKGLAGVPASLTASLDQLRSILAALQNGGAVDNLNATMASMRDAAESVNQATGDLPALIAQLNGVAARADQTIESLGPNSPINRETLVLLREVRDAAKSVTDLATAIQRKPNSVLFGR